MSQISKPPDTGSEVNVAVASCKSCPLCTSKLPELASLSSHLLTCHLKDTFRCVACTDSVAIFPTYTLAYQHSVMVHQVTLDQAIQSSILLPDNLERFKCKLCSKDDVFLTEEAVTIHLGTHSNFFAKRWVKNSVRVCRICDESLGEVAVENHFKDNHPRENFADVSDVEEPTPLPTVILNKTTDIKEAKPLETKTSPSENENIKSKKSKNKSDKSSDEKIQTIMPSGDDPFKKVKRKDTKKRKVPIVISKSSEDECEVSHKKAACSDQNQEKLWNSFKPDNLMSKYFSSLPKPKISVNNEVKNNNLSKAISAFIKKEKVVDNSHSPPIKIKEEKIDIKPSNMPSVKELESENDNSCDKSKYNNAVIPLPCVDFPYQAPCSYQKMFYSCTVCTHSPIFESFSSWAQHRESEDHRYSYGKAFIINNCCHFEDASFSTDLSKMKSLMCWKCSTQFHNRWDLNLHYRTTHMKKKTFPVTDPYCHTCKMPVLSYPEAPPHTEVHKKLMRESYACRMCDLRVYSNGLAKHNEVAHGEQLFKCKLGQCGDARPGDTEFKFGRALHLYPRWLLQHQARMHGLDEEGGVLSSNSCQFPKSLVQISCRVCPYHFLGEDRALMIKHLKNCHNYDRRDLINFSCRVCDMPGDTIADVIDHAKTHLLDKHIQHVSKKRDGFSGYDQRNEASSEESEGGSYGSRRYRQPYKYRDDREYHHYRYRSSSSYSSRSDHHDRNSRYRDDYRRSRSRSRI